jgi:hypothetical protein
MSLVQPSYVQHVFVQKFAKVILLLKVSPHVTLHVSTDMVINRCLQLLFDGNCCASVSMVPIF